MLKCISYIVLFLFCCSNAEYVGVAHIVGESVVGHVYFVSLNTSHVLVWANISVASNSSALGLHVHTYGDINNKAGMNAGGHHIGSGVDVHQCEDNPARHEGDMGNWEVQNGAILQNKTLDLLTLSGSTSIIGRSVILHGIQDGCLPNSTFGPRIAQGVIGIANLAYLPQEVAAFLQTNSSNLACSGGKSVGDQMISSAVVVLSPLSGSNIYGVVTFEQDETGAVNVKAVVHGLNPVSPYGIHIHEFGDLHSEDGMAAGSHYNPFKSAHGIPDSSRHIGDLGNICTFDADGHTSYYEHTFYNLLSLSGNDSVIGRNIIIHSLYDTGGSVYGSRIAQGVIGIGYNYTSISFPSNITINSPECESYYPLEVAVAHLSGTSFDQDISGTVYFVSLNSTHTWVWADITGISNNIDGLHGLHIHALGDTNDSEKGLFVGGHYIGVTGQDVHSCENASSRHEGDMGNWEAKIGIINGVKTLNLIALTGPFSVIGRAVVLHNQTDNCVNVSSSGNRLAQGVIGIANLEFLPEEVQAIRNISANSMNNAISGEAPTKAIAVLTPSTAGTQLKGIVTFEQNNNGSITVKARITGLERDSVHGFHIHLYGDLSGTSEHYNPFNVSHGLAPSPSRHVGDLGNICSYDDGVTYYEYTFTDLLTLNGNSSIIGRSVVIDANRDDGITSGTSAIIAQGIIGYGSTSTNISIPSDVQINSPACDSFSSTSTTTSTTTSTATTASVTSTTTGPSSTTSTPTSAPNKKGSGGLSGIAKVGIAFFVLVVVAIIIANVLYYNRHKRLPCMKSRAREYSSGIDYVAFNDNDMDL